MARIRIILIAALGVLLIIIAMGASGGQVPHKVRHPIDAATLAALLAIPTNNLSQSNYFAVQASWNGITTNCPPVGWPLGRVKLTWTNSWCTNSGLTNALLVGRQSGHYLITNVIGANIPGAYQCMTYPPPPTPQVYTFYYGGQPFYSFTNPPAPPGSMFFKDMPTVGATWVAIYASTDMVNWLTNFAWVYTTNHVFTITATNLPN